MGLKKEKNIITIKPCIPDEWEKYFIRYEYESSVYNIKIKNIKKTNKVQELYINGMKQENKEIQLIDNNKIYDVEVFL